MTTNDDVLQNQNVSDDSENTIRDELDLEAEVLLREVAEDNKKFENEITPKINQYGDNVNSAIEEAEKLNKELSAVTQELSLKSAQVIQKIGIIVNS